MNEEQKKKIEQLKQRVNPNSLTMNRVPKKELGWFKEWAKEEYESDYGMAFKELIRVSEEYYFMRDTIVNLINLLSLKEKQLLSRGEPEESAGIKMGSGKVLDRRN